MNETQIQIVFPKPGEWTRFTMTAVFPDKDGFVQHCRYTQAGISAEHLQAFEGVVSAISVLSDDWQARQVWARLRGVPVFTEDDFSESPNMAEAVVLTVEAVNIRGGRRMFTSADYPDFTIEADDAKAFFQHFTRSRNSGMENGI